MRKPILLTVALALVVLTTTTACLTGADAATRVTAHFPDSAGLFVGNDVGVLGVPIGKVVKITPDGEAVKVTFEFDSDVSVPADAAAVIISKSVATDRYVELTPAYASGTKMKTGDEIPLERTQTPVDFDEVLKAVNGFAAGIAGSRETSQAVRRFVRAGANTFGPNGQVMNDAIHDLGDAVNGFSQQKDSFVGTLDSLDELTTKLGENQQVLRGFLSSTAKATRMLSAERSHVREALTTLGTAVAVVSRFAHRNKNAIKGTANDVAAVSDTLLARKQQLGEFLELMPLFTQNLNQTVTGGEALVRAPTTSVFGGPSVQQLCQQLASDACDLVGTDPFGALNGVIGPLLALLFAGAQP